MDVAVVVVGHTPPFKYKPKRRSGQLPVRASRRSWKIQPTKYSILRELTLRCGYSSCSIDRVDATIGSVPANHHLLSSLITFDPGSGTARATLLVYSFASRSWPTSSSTNEIELRESPVNLGASAASADNRIQSRPTRRCKKERPELMESADP